jgi:hypothetical protein
MSTRPWTARTWVVAIGSCAASSTAVTLARQGVWWPLIALGGVWAGIGLVAWWLWRDDREMNDTKGDS